jgi:hypothetical protein
MSQTIRFRGVVRNVTYDPRLRTGSLKTYPADEFDINAARANGIIQFDTDTTLGYARWTAPKRTRTGALPRVYNIYHLPKKVVVIPVIKDEGYQTNNDRINAITYSWMNLANVYIVLAWYERAKAHPRKYGRITRQNLHTNFVHARLAELRTYQQTALHWNTMHFERDFAHVYEQSVASYDRIAQETGAVLVPSAAHLAVLDSYKVNGAFNLDRFREVSLPRSYDASQREVQTDHPLEYLTGDSKAYFAITNWLGGEYHLTSDEVYASGNHVIIQESKNTSTSKLPSLDGIKDGLFKLILFANMDELYLDDRPVTFAVRLKLTGKLEGRLVLPGSDETLRDFARANSLSSGQHKRLQLLNEETRANPRLEIEVTGNNSPS